MSFVQTLILGAISGLTIFLGLPLARLNTKIKEHIAFLNAFAIGVLFFLFVDIVHHADEPIEEALKEGSASSGLLIGVMVLGVSLGLLSLVYYGQRVLKQGEDVDAQRLALLIAVGIGLHNFSEGLAIGSAARAGAMSLAFLLIAGFGLHNITEAFGISAPLVENKPGWRFLGLLGLIAGGPNFLGTLVGYSFSSEPVSVFFLSLAAGAIMYVIGELLAAGRKFNLSLWNGWGITAGFLAGLLTELFLASVGG
jgi:ZIP family zinc transporter